MIKIIFSMLMFVIVHAPISSIAAMSGQQKEVRGTVTDEQGSPLSGVSVLVQGTTQGTTTNKDGYFVLQGLSSRSVLTFRSVGYTSQDIVIGELSQINVLLKLDTEALDEVVVVGFGKQKKETVTGSIVSVDSKQLVETPVANLSSALVGRVAGISYTQASGEPGNNATTIRIRGVGTLNSGGQEPLVIIDGIQSTFSVMNAIDANEVENISILKDASATAVYGVRGANGVIIVTTRRGKLGTPKLNFSSSLGFTQLASRVKMLGSYDYALFRNEAIRSDNDASFDRFLFSDDELWKFQNNRDYTPAEVNALNLTDAQRSALLESPALYYSSHDYFEEQFGGMGPQQQYNLNISGGNERVRYFSSLGYFDQKGVLRNTNYGDADVNSKYDRYNFRSNYDIDATKNLKVTVDIAGQFVTSGGILGSSQDGDITGNYSRHKAMLGSIYSSSPFSGPGIVDGHLVTSFANNNNPLQSKGAGGYSPTATLLGRPYLTRAQSNLNANVKLVHTLDYLIEGLNISGTVSYNNSYNKGIYRQRSIPGYMAARNQADPSEILFFGGVQNPDELRDNYGNGKWRRLYMESAINYANRFGRHSVTGLILANAQRTYDPGLRFQVPSGLMGLATRGTYNYSERYLAELNIGYNGSENFPEGKRFGIFPAYSLGWVASNESFFKKNDWVTWVKIRGSYGEVGNDQIGGRRFLYLPSTWGYSGNYAYGGYFFGNSNGSSRDPFYTGAVESTIGNPNVTWERAKKSNIALEMNFFKNKLSFIGDIFREERDNILWQLGTIPGIVGGDLPPANIGKVSNRGYEFQLGWADRVGEFQYGIRGNMSYARNKIEYMDEPPYPHAWMNQTGYSIGQYKGLQNDGFYNTAEEAAKHINSTVDGNRVQAGDLRYKDANGDNFIDTKDHVPIGHTNLPRYTFGANLDFSYKGFSLSALFTGSAEGSFMISGFYLMNPFYMTNGAAFNFQYEDRWTPEKVAQGISPGYPRASLRNYSNINGQTSDFWLRSSDHIRLKNVEVGYTFSKLGILKRSGLDAIRVYANGNNLITWSGLMEGIDPEQQQGGGASEGYLYPMTRIYNFGLTIQF